MIGVKTKEDQEQLNPGAHERLGMVRSGLLRVKFDNLGWALLKYTEISTYLN